MSNRGFSKADVQKYRTEGYLVVNRFFDADTMAGVDRTIREMTQAAMQSGDYSKVLELEPQSGGGEPVARRIYNPFDQHETFQKLASDEKLLDCIESLIGPDITLHHSKLNMKPAKVGSAVEWHQDMAYFPHTNDDLVTCLVYLDDATAENGCLQVLPRHHTHFFNHARQDGTFAGMITEDLDSGRWGQPVPLEAPAGSVIFMHCITPHNSLANRSDRARRTLIFEYRAADAFPIYYGDMTNIAEARYRQLRGASAQAARLAGPSPIIPRVGKYASLYELQSNTKSQTKAS